MRVTEAAQVRTGSAKRDAKEKPSNASLSFERKRNECTGVTYSSCRDRGSCKLLQEKPIHMRTEDPIKGSTKTNKGLTMSFYGVEELEELRKRYPT